MEEEKKVWKWWEEDNVLPEGVKWKFLEHKGPMFAPAYTPLPPEVRFWYDGKILRLTEETEECATFYGRMLDHDYTTKEVFNKNFFKDWRKTMTEKEKEIIRDLSKCDFSEIDAHFKKMSEERKNRSKDEKNKEKEYQASLVAEYGLCNMDGHMEKIGNFRTEPPSLFRGRGEHPKQGMIKRRRPKRTRQRKKEGSGKKRRNLTRLNIKKRRRKGELEKRKKNRMVGERGGKKLRKREEYGRRKKRLLEVNVRKLRKRGG